MLTLIVVVRGSSQKKPAISAPKSGLVNNWSAEQQPEWNTSTHTSRSASNKPDRPQPRAQKTKTISRPAEATPAQPTKKRIEISTPKATGIQVFEGGVDFSDGDEDEERNAALSSPAKTPGTRLSSNVSVNLSTLLCSNITSASGAGCR